MIIINKDNISVVSLILVAFLAIAIICPGVMAASVSPDGAANGATAASNSQYWITPGSAVTFSVNYAGANGIHIGQQYQYGDTPYSYHGGATIETWNTSATSLTYQTYGDTNCIEVYFLGGSPGSGYVISGSGRYFKVKAGGPARDPPVASFTMSNAGGGTAPLSQTVTSTSTGSPTNFKWQVQYESDTPITVLDGAASSTSFTMTNPGHYTVTLTATNAYGNSKSSQTVLVTLGKPTASFTATPLIGTPPLNVAFHDTSSGQNIQYFQWDYGDGTGYGGSSLGQEVDGAKTYSALGSYTVTLKVGNAAGETSASKVITVAKTPYTITPTPTQTIATIPPTTIPTLVPIQTIPTLTNVSPVIINKADVREQVNNTVVGGLLTPYLNLCDDLGNNTQNFGVTVASTLMTPFQSLTAAITKTLGNFREATQAFIIPAHFFMIFLAAMLSALPALAQGLIIVVLSGTGIYLVLRGKAGNG